MEVKKGVLYIVATPIGNLEDITFRAVEVMENVDIILAEDTRYTAKLLNHYNIATRSVSYRDQNHEKVVGEIVSALQDGMSLALVSDSGTPLISDPGYKLVAQIREKGLKIETIPGPSAVVAALSISGLPTDKFTFLGFLPKSDKKRLDLLKLYGELDATLVIYESPNRLVRLLKLFSEVFPSRRCAVASDLTKIYESLIYGSSSEVFDHYSVKENIKGEYVVMLSKEFDNKAVRDLD